MTRRADRQVQIVWGHKTPDIDQKLDDITPWVLEAGRPYYDVFLEGTDPHEVIGRWMQRRSSELALRRTRLAVADDRIGGGYIAIAGSDLAGCRQADLLDLARSMDDHSYSELRARMNDLDDLFAPVEAHDFYLSKLGVMPRLADRELEHPLMDDCIRRARHGGFGQVRTDVCEDDDEMRGLLDTYGFRPIYRGKSSRTNLRYLSMSLEV